MNGLLRFPVLNVPRCNAPFTALAESVKSDGGKWRSTHRECLRTLAVHRYAQRTNDMMTVAESQPPPRTAVVSDVRAGGVASHG